MMIVRMEARERELGEEVEKWKSVVQPLPIAMRTLLSHFTALLDGDRHKMMLWADRAMLPVCARLCAFNQPSRFACSVRFVTVTMYDI